MKLALGIDGGGTSTRVCLVGSRGRVAGRGEAGIGNVHHAGPELVLENLRSAIGSALEAAGAEPTSVGAVFAGMAGVTHERSRAGFQHLLGECGLGGAAIEVDHDIRIALAGGLSGRPGVALIVGTGSSCYGRTADGRAWQTGGWGSLLADEGSGYDLGRAAMVAAVRMADGREPETALRAAVFGWLGIASVDEVLRRVHEQDLSRTEIASLAPRVSKLAATGDPAAQSILQHGAGQLAKLVESNHRRLPTGDHPEVVITGGLGTKDARYQLLIESAIRERVPQAVVRKPELSPAAGAALLALGLLGPGNEAAWAASLKESGDVG